MTASRIGFFAAGFVSGFLTGSLFGPSVLPAVIVGLVFGPVAVCVSEAALGASIINRRILMALTLAAVSVIAFAGWRSVFVGGWHISGDGSYECPHSPWRTVLHPLPPNAFGEMFRGLPEECNRDAKRVLTGWSIFLLIAAGGTTIILRRLASGGARSESAATDAWTT